MDTKKIMFTYNDASPTWATLAERWTLAPDTYLKKYLFGFNWLKNQFFKIIPIKMH